MFSYLTDDNTGPDLGLKRLTRTELSSSYRFLGAYDSVDAMLSAHPVYDETKVFLRDVPVDDMVSSYGYFSLKDLLDIGGRLRGLHLAKSWRKTRLEVAVTTYPGHTCLSFVFKLLPRARGAKLWTSQQRYERSARVDRDKDKEKNSTVERKREWDRRQKDVETAEKEASERARQNAFPQVADLSLKRKIVEDVRQSMSVDAHRKGPCAACGEGFRRGELREVKANNVDLSLLSNESVPDELLPVEYDAQAYGKAILHPLALQDFGTPSATLSLCKSCCDSLSNGKKPPLALSNGFYFAHAHLSADVARAFADATEFDLLMVSRVRGNTLTYKYSEKSMSPVYGQPRSKSQSYMKGNLMVLPQDALALSNVLPPPPDDLLKSMVVLFTAHGKKEVSKEQLQRFRPVLVSSHVVRTLITFLLEKNRAYRVVDGDFAVPATFSEANLRAMVDPSDLDKERALPATLVIGSMGVEDEGVASGTGGYVDREDFHEGGQPEDVLVDAVTWSDEDPTNESYRKMKLRALRWAKEGHSYVRSKTGSGFVKDFDSPHLLAWMWPKLDPFGLGGFADQCRDIPVDMRTQVRHLLMLHDSPFAKDPTFAFTCYNILRKREVWRSVRFRVKASQQRRVLNDLLNIDPETLKSMEERYFKDDKYRPHGEEEERVVRTLKKLNFVVGDAHGTAGYKLRCRNQIRSMIYSLSTPALFGTLNPFDLAHPLVHLLAGNEIDLDDAVRGDWELDSFRRAVTVAKNPAAAAEFFHIAVTSFIENVLRFGKDDGLFGKCTGYYGMVETQGRGTLHVHFLIWLDGNLSPQALRDRMASDPEYKARLFAWMEDIIKNHLPNQTEVVQEPEGQPLKKPGHGLRINPQLQEVPFSGDLTDKEFVAQMDEVVTALVKEVSWHEHNFTCWKYLKRWEPRDDAHCRMRIDGSTHPETTIDPETESIVLKRLHPRINSHNDFITYLFRCNSDWKYIGSGELAKALVFYMTDYMTKVDLPVSTLR